MAAAARTVRELVTLLALAHVDPYWLLLGILSFAFFPFLLPLPLSFS